MERYGSAGTQGSTVGGQARETLNEAQRSAREGLDEGRRAAEDVMRDVKERGRRLADRAGELAAEGKRRVVSAARDLGGYAEENTALVAVAMLAVGILIGRYLVPSEG